MSAVQMNFTLSSLRIKPVATVAVVLLAILQLNAAGHQFDHTVSDFADDCSYCLQLDRLDDVDATESVAAPITKGRSTAIDSAVPQLSSKPARSSQARAPPIS